MEPKQNKQTHPDLLDDGLATATREMMRASGWTLATWLIWQLAHNYGAHKICTLLGVLVFAALLRSLVRLHPPCD